MKSIIFVTAFNLFFVPVQDTTKPIRDSSAMFRDSAKSIPTAQQILDTTEKMLDSARIEVVKGFVQKDSLIHTYKHKKRKT